VLGGQFFCLLPIPAKVEALPQNEAASSIEKEEKSDAASLHVLSSHREGVWKVKLMIDTKRLGGDLVGATECGGFDREDEDGCCCIGKLNSAAKPEFLEACCCSFSPAYSEIQGKVQQQIFRSCNHHCRHYCNHRRFRIFRFRVH
ncbi:hypothetical protein LINPERPRIM_LOCUS20400, partial [Linum perenne]